MLYDFLIQLLRVEAEAEIVGMEIEVGKELSSVGNEVEAVEDGHVRQILADLADLLANCGQRNAEAAVGAGPVVSPDRGDGEDLGVRVERGETGVDL